MEQCSFDLVPQYFEECSSASVFKLLSVSSFFENWMEHFLF
jgi:hypothetical protein